MSESDTTKIRTEATKVVATQSELCQERYAKDKDVVRIEQQIRTQWWLHGLLVAALLALAWKVLTGAIVP